MLAPARSAAGEHRMEGCGLVTRAAVKDHRMRTLGRVLINARRSASEADRKTLLVPTLPLRAENSWKIGAATASVIPP